MPFDLQDMQAETGLMFASFNAFKTFIVPSDIIVVGSKTKYVHIKDFKKTKLLTQTYQYVYSTY